MSFLATTVKWAMENPKLMRALVIAILVCLAAVWIHHEGAKSAVDALRAKGQSAVLHVREQYDEISNHRTDDHGLVKLLRAGKF